MFAGQPLSIGVHPKFENRGYTPIFTGTPLFRGEGHLYLDMDP